MESLKIEHMISNHINKHKDCLYELKRIKNEDTFFVLDDFELSFKIKYHTQNKPIDYRSMFGNYKVVANDFKYISKDFVLEWTIRRNFYRLFKALSYHDFDKNIIEHEVLTITKRNKNGN